MQLTDFAKHMTVFFGSYLPDIQNRSRNTIISYSNAFRHLLIFCRDVCNISPERLSFEEFNETLVTDFLEWLQNERGNSVSTRNQRLHAIHAFCRYVQLQEPDLIHLCQRILQIPDKKYQKPLIRYLSLKQTKALLATPDPSCRSGRRDMTLLSVLYDTGARIQEFCDLRLHDVCLASPATIVFAGNGRKTRHVPISSNTEELLRLHLHEARIECMDTPLFFLRRRSRPTQDGVGSLLRKHAVKAFAHVCPDMHKSITPQTLRNSKAVHLYQAGVDPVYIQDMLGIAHFGITDRYVRAGFGLDEEWEQAHPGPSPEIVLDWNPAGEDLLEFLKNL